MVICNLKLSDSFQFRRLNAPLSIQESEDSVLSYCFDIFNRLNWNFLKATVTKNSFASFSQNRPTFIHCWFAACLWYNIYLIFIEKWYTFNYHNINIFYLLIIWCQMIAYILRSYIMYFSSVSFHRVFSFRREYFSWSSHDCPRADSIFLLAWSFWVLFYKVLTTWSEFRHELTLLNAIKCILS